ncbi:glycosyltransferase family 4 protein [Pedobacter sp. AW31-3R]|uniref:glycosyltransferase family 4 protein n=1 Tax=Pedobacter sp. AW31-3R TaxID=3445781 RepID=UPI003FA09289
MDKIRVVEAGNELDLGGTEYVIQLFSKFFNKDYFEVIVVGVYSGGQREKLIRDLGIPVFILNGDMNSLAQILIKTDVFHWHGSGLIDKAVFNVVKAYRPKLVIQTNIFGLYDYSPLYNLIDYDLYVSKMILIRRVYLDHLIPEHLFLSKRKVLSNPVDVDHILELLPTDEEVCIFRKINHLEDQFIVGRIGRADNRKFDLITLDAFAEFAHENDKAIFLLVGATDEILAYASSLGITDKIVVLEMTTDLKEIVMYYSVMDIFLAASKIGESFGLVIAEAMTIGVPVITICTDDRDNAQVELVDNNITGCVVERSIKKIAGAISDLYNDPDMRKRMAVRSREKVVLEYKADRIVRSLEVLILNHFGFPLPAGYNNALSLNPTDYLIEDYSINMITDYIHRCQNLWTNE